MKTLGEKIRENRLRKNLTQAELANEAELTVRTVSKYETDTVMPKGRNLYRLARALGVSVAYLMQPEIEDPTYGLDEEPYLDAARAKFGKKGQDEMENLLSGVKAMFAGGEIPQENKDQFFQAVMQAYLACKEDAHDKFTPKKYRE